MTDRSEALGKNLFVYVTKEHGFGSDALLLADFAAPKRGSLVCDLGTGCGIIALLVLRDYEPAEVYAVDISEKACALLKRTVEDNKISESLVCVNADLRELKGVLPLGKFDAVTVNPPYKKLGAGLKNPDTESCTARHEVCCDMPDIARAARGLLKSGGKLYMCQRPERLAEVLSVLRDNALEPKRLRLVAQREGREPSLFLLEARKDAGEGMRIAPTLYIEQPQGGYTQEAREIFEAYKKK
ncbi:MAG: methyltransferase [Clostridiales bacterium]|nr:methyltransferase [Clostridiales bacterium]